MHIPAFPPQWKDFAPGNPWDGQPPLPAFLWNPWLTSEQRSTLEAETSTWAARRAEAMVGPRGGFETARRAAHHMLESYTSRLPPLAPAKAPAKRERRARKPSITEALRPTELTPKIEEGLTDAALEEVIRIRERHRRLPTTNEKAELAKAVVDWAEDLHGVTISEEKGAEIVNKSLARFAPVRS